MLSFFEYIYISDIQNFYVNVRPDVFVNGFIFLLIKYWIDLNSEILFCSLCLDDVLIAKF